MTRTLLLAAALLAPLAAHAQQPITPEQQALGITAWIATMTQELASSKAAVGACQAELATLKAKAAPPAAPAPEAPKP
jgi:hypothetical protein